MKKMMKLLTIVAAAAMCLTACSNEFDEPNRGNNRDDVVVTFVAEPETTRTSVDTTGDVPLFSWGTNETFALLEQTDALAQATSVNYKNVDGKANITATFAANPDKGAYKYIAVYPASGYVEAENINSATLSLPASQTMAETSYDPKADLMVSKAVATEAQPTEAQPMQFTRIAAVVKMTLKNYNIEADDKVEKVVFTADGKSLAGTITADLTLPHEFTAAEGVSSVSVATTSTSDIYFTVLPTTLEAGDSYTITVITNKKLYVKQGTIPADKALTFEAGMVNRFGVNMMGVEGSDKWVLVKDASTLKEGDIVTIAAKNYNYVIGKQSTNYPLASRTEVIKLGDYLYHPTATTETSVDDRLQSYTLLQRDASRIAFDFYNGFDYEGDETIGFVYATGSNYSPKIQAYCDVNTLFDLTITDGAATLCATDIEKTYKYWRYYNTGSAASRRFDCTTSEPTGNYQICIYKLEGRVGTIPVIPANITIPDEDESVIIAEEGTTEATAISEVVFNYVNNWTISATTEAEWLDVAYDTTNNCLTYTAEANTGAKRETIVTITATREGQESLTWTFNVTQKGAPTEITIAEFIKLSKDENSTYKITGKVTVLATSESGYYSLADEEGNVAQVRYVRTDSGDILCKQDIIKVGDVMTVTTVVTTSTGKGGSSAHPSIYKGHYRLTATADNNLIGYEGGTATITINKEGNLQPTDCVVKGAIMSDECDFATFTYTDDADTATLAVGENSGGSRSIVIEFTYGLASTTVTIGQQNHPSVKVGWFLVTDINELAVGDQVIIAAKNPDETLDYALVKQTSSGSSKSQGQAITLQGNSISDATGVEQFTLENGHADYPGTWAFKGNSYNKYIYNSGSSLKFSSSLDAKGSWAVSIDSDGKATLVSQANNYAKNTMMFNYTTSNQNFNVFEPTQTGKGAIYIYKYYN